jgi:hypothetical protein
MWIQTQNTTYHMTDPMTISMMEKGRLVDSMVDVLETLKAGKFYQCRRDG